MHSSPSVSLPTYSTFTTLLFDSLSSLPLLHPSSTHPLTATSTFISTFPLPPAVKNIFLTLHCLFPNEFLSALDLLDRGSLIRFQIVIPRNLSTVLAHEPQTENVVFYVRSSKPTRTSRYASSSFTPRGYNYEVRLKSWNCTCPAFTLASLDIEESSRSKNGREVGEDGHWPEEVERERRWSFGGLLGMNKGEGKGNGVCKHLIACVLVETSELFKGLVHERVVSKEEAAGWAAGWGD